MYWWNTPSQWYLLILFGWVLVGFLIIEFLVVIAAVVFVALLFVVAIILMVVFMVFVGIIIYGILTIISFGLFLIFLSSPILIWFMWIALLFGTIAFFIVGSIAVPLAYFIP